MKVRTFKILLSIVVTFSIGYYLLRQQFHSGKERPLIIAHGGAKLLFPENTMIAFDGSDSIGVDMLEMDILLTKDSILICHHSENLKGTTEIDGNIADYTLDELKEFNFGYNFKDLSGCYTYRDKYIPVTSLEDVFIKYGKKYAMCIELKNKDSQSGDIAIRKLYALLEKYNMKNKVIVSCFDDNIMARFRQVSKESVCTATAQAESKKLIILSNLFLDFIYTSKHSVMQVPTEANGFQLDKQRLVDAAHNRNMEIHYWTVNEPEEIKKLIKLKVDGIITDRPDIVKQVMNEVNN